MTTPITLQQLTVPNAANLAGLDGLFVPWWLDSQSSAFAADIAARGGVVAASNGSGQATAAYWAPGTFDGITTAGALFVFGDVDMVSDFGFATYSPANANGIFALNAIATVITAAGGGGVIEEPPVTAPVPVPASIVLFGAGLLGLAGLRRRA